jgi:hypothetical protein
VGGRTDNSKDKYGGSSLRSGDAETTAENHLVVGSGGRPGESDLGSPVVVVGVGEMVDRSQARGGQEVCGGRSEDGLVDAEAFVVERLEVFPAEAGVDGEVLGDLPVVLDEGGDVVVAEVALAIRDTTVGIRGNLIVRRGTLNPPVELIVSLVLIANQRKEPPSRSACHP